MRYYYIFILRFPNLYFYLLSYLYKNLIIVKHKLQFFKRDSGLIAYFFQGFIDGLYNKWMMRLYCYDILFCLARKRGGFHFNMTSDSPVYLVADVLEQLDDAGIAYIPTIWHSFSPATAHPVLYKAQDCIYPYFLDRNVGGQLHLCSS